MTGGSSYRLAGNREEHEPVWRRDLVAWPTNIADIVKAEIGVTQWDEAKTIVRGKYGIDLPHMEKNSLFIGYVLAQTWEKDLRSETLLKLCAHILRFAAEVQGVRSSASKAD